MRVLRTVCDLLRRDARAAAGTVSQGQPGDFEPGVGREAVGREEQASPSMRTQASSAHPLTPGEETSVLSTMCTTDGAFSRRLTYDRK